MQNKFFRSEKITDTTTRIAGLGGELCYLVEGKERALLIDGLVGVGSLRAFVRELTDLPVQMAVTHGHIDHVGAAWEYGEVFIQPDDLPMLFSKMSMEPEGRLRFAANPGYFREEKRTGLTLNDVVPAGPVKAYPIYEGDVFDLGGVRLEVIEVPGHTYGTVVFLNRDERIVFSGDACNVNTLLSSNASTSIEEYLESLKHFKTYQDAFDIVYGGHGERAFPNTIIDDGIALCGKILAGEDDAVETVSFGGKAFLAAKRGDNFLPLCGGFCNIVYSREHIHKTPKPDITDGPVYGSRRLLH
ncbi:MAG: MBL fold metallo-hydrolase [Firmicutes bacterium]|nr:MBL fold metallo-hydrolase [Bacillota bacterium]